MQNIRETASRLTDQMQSVIGFLEIDQPQKALHPARAAILTLHVLMTAIALQAAELDALLADLQRHTGETLKKNPPKPSTLM
jgi:hypothetical protein